MSVHTKVTLDDEVIRFDCGALSITIDPGDLFSDAEPEVRMRLAESLCWDEVMREAAARLVGESENWSGYADSRWGDQRTRLEFLRLVESRALMELEAEVERLRKRAEGEERKVQRVLAWAQERHPDFYRRVVRVMHGEATR